MLTKSVCSDEGCDSMAGKAIRDSRSDKAFYMVTYVILALFTLCVLYPLIFIVSSSFSSGIAVSTGRVYLWPVDFSLDGYKTVFAYQRLLTSYGNTIFYTVVGTTVNVILTMMTAYPLAMPRFQFKRIYLFIFSFTMFFNGGLVPNYLLISDLGLVNTRWAMIVPFMLNTYNLVVTRTFIESSIPKELLEASQIDGCSWFRYFFNIVLPLSKAIMAVMTLYYAVYHWNSYFSAMIYLNDLDKQPLQIVLRDILILNQAKATDADTVAARANMEELMKYSIIIVSSVPILCLYPFVQKYFMKGVMIGSIKG